MKNENGNMTGETPDGGIRARGLTKRFGTNIAVDGLDLEILPGEIFGLVGPDGAGKTTTMRLLCGILEPDAGEAAVGGFDVRQDPEGVKSQIGYMAQRFSLYGDLTVAENIHFFANLFNVPYEEISPREQRLLAASRMEPFRERLARNLSGGMKQKLALTCTLIHQPKILFLDEPTTGVDPVSRRDFWKILYELVRQGMTLVVSTPYMDEAERCNRIAFMDGGHLLRCAIPRDLKRILEGQMLEVSARPAIRARSTLTGLSGVSGVQVFGDRLHVRIQIPIDRATVEINEALERASIPCERIRPIQPTLEDAFIGLVENHSAKEFAP